MKRIDYAIFQLREDMEDNVTIRFASYNFLMDLQQIRERMKK